MIFRQNNGGSRAIWDNAAFGPAFGDSPGDSGHDLYFSVHYDRTSQLNANSYQTNPLGISQGRYMAGSNDISFYVPEIEAYQVSGLFSTSLNTGTPSELNKKLLDLLMTSTTNDFSRVEYQLLWRASETGFANANFHQRVKGYANTLSIIKTTAGAIFGGFTSLVWNSYYNYYTDSKAFIYSLVNPNNNSNVSTLERKIKKTLIEQSILDDDEASKSANEEEDEESNAMQTSNSSGEGSAVGQKDDEIVSEIINLQNELKAVTRQCKQTLTNLVEISKHSLVKQDIRKKISLLDSEVNFFFQSLNNFY